MYKSIYREAYRLLRELLVKQRKNIGISQYELADRLNRPQSFVAKIEGGERRIDVIEFLDITRALEADPLEILREVAVLHGKSQDEVNE